MNFTSKIRSALSQNRKSQSERYLNEATSLVDLEQREREISAGRFSPRRYY